MYHSNLTRPSVPVIKKSSISRGPRKAWRLSRPATFLLILALLVSSQHSAPGIRPAHAQDQQPVSSWITTRDGQSFFVLGANYEGPTDRAWKMWDDDKFDQVLIGADFARARS